MKYNPDDKEAIILIYIYNKIYIYKNKKFFTVTDR